jgi:integrase
MKTIKITKSVVEQLPHPTKGQDFYRDQTLVGFGLYAGVQSKTYYVEKRINGKSVRTAIGRHGQISAQRARERAQEILGVMSTGVNPNDEKRSKLARGVSLKQVYEDYKETRKDLKPKTLYDYDRIMKAVFHGWHRKAVTDITKDMIERRHKKIGEENGPAYANLAMKFLRSLFNFAIGKYEDSKGRPFILENPVNRLSQTRAWYRVDRRRREIKSSDLPIWYETVSDLPNDILRDYLILLLFTGLRKQEALNLGWDHVDLTNKTLTITDTKNRIPLILPLSDFIFELLKKRNTSRDPDSKFVFPGQGKTSHLVEPREAVRKVRKLSNIEFSLHDLRRTFITNAESLDIPHYALKQLVNHKQGNDVTAGYIVSDPERLRIPMQKVTDKLLRMIGIRQTGKIVELTKRAQ